jgi:hypothetical protein
LFVIFGLLITIAVLTLWNRVNVPFTAVLMQRGAVLVPVRVC